MNQIQRSFRKAGKAIGRFFADVKQGNPLDIAILAVGALLVIVLIAILVMTVTGNTKPEEGPDSELPPPVSESVPESVPESAPESVPALDPQEFEGTVLPKTEDGGQAYLDETLFIGDSNTYRLESYRLTSWQNNLSAVGMGIQHVTGTPCMYFKDSDQPFYLAKAVAMMQPRRIIITYGTNNTNSTTDTFIKQYRAALDAISKAWPYADIIINAIPPVSKTRAGAASEQKATDEFNHALAQMAQEDGYKFLNSAEVLKNPDTGYIKNEYVIEDGLHLNEKGARAWMNYVSTHTFTGADRRPALTSVPTHVPTPEEVFNPQAQNKDDSSSESNKEGVTVTFSVKKGDEKKGELKGTFTQTVKPGKECKPVTAVPKDGYKLTWGCSEGSIANVNEGKLVFTVPSWTKQKKIEVWVSFTEGHKHAYGEWKYSGDNITNHTHTRTCIAEGCSKPPRTETEKCTPGNWITDPDNPAQLIQKCTKCGMILGSKPAPHKHVFGPWQYTGDHNLNHTHTRTCTAPGCTNPPAAETGKCTAGDWMDDPANPAQQIRKCTVCGAIVEVRAKEVTPPPTPEPPAPPESESVPEGGGTPTPPDGGGEVPPAPEAP